MVENAAVEMDKVDEMRPAYSLERVEKEGKVEKPKSQSCGGIVVPLPSGRARNQPNQPPLESVLI